MERDDFFPDIGGCHWMALSGGMRRFISG
jgi:hypothetical protein